MAAQPIGDVLAGVVRLDQRVEVQAPTPEHGADEGATRGPDHDVGVIGVPPGGEFEGHQPRHLVGGAGDPAAPQDEPYSRHVSENTVMTSNRPRLRQ